VLGKFTSSSQELSAVLKTSPLRYHVGGLFYGSRVLHRAAVVKLPSDAGLPTGTDSVPRLIGLCSLTGERYVLLDLGYEVLDVLREAVSEEARP
jgi:hypothetical protein